MKIKIWLFVAASLSLITSCSGTGGLSGLNGNGATADFGDISQSSIEYFSKTVGDTIYFEVDKSSLNQITIDTLQAQALWLQENNLTPITIEGHADEQGTREYNLALGARRATSVRNFLVSQGVSEDRLSIVTYGKERPVEVCSEEKCSSKNRRAVTVVSGGLGD